MKQYIPGIIGIGLIVICVVVMVCYGISHQRSDRGHALNDSLDIFKLNNSYFS